MNLLMVNDTVLELRTMEHTIRWEQYGIQKVFTAQSAEVARTILQNQNIDILLCDIEMPGEDGISLIRWIRKNNFDIDCILLTCHADFVYAREAISLNCQEYILLPAKYETIGATVQKIGQKRQERLHELQLQEYGKNWLKKQSDSIIHENNSMSPKETVGNCTSYILENLDNENLNVSDIAAHFYLNAIYLNRIFKKEKGLNISQWIIKKRMQLAAELLQNSEHTANAVAHQVGYTNYPYFSTVFKKYFNCTPSQYAEKNKK
ncbi:response regulator transcription factor [Mediterraneibacter massiliensis]|uniref:response regulator transcription factor n=1 Tax=Mediterraneibacter massiliensis TaxID=1720300 RepID=UPI0024AD36C4|nr:helix-turn-helix domain-containing protein [Mediterraneibacter massiliensis]